MGYDPMQSTAQARADVRNSQLARPRRLTDKWSAMASGKKKRDVWSYTCAAMLARLYLRHCT